MMKKHIILSAASILIAFIMIINTGSAVYAKERSQINVLPDTNTNIFDENMLELLSKITETAAESDNVSIYYCDTETGYYFSYKPDNVYRSASTIKAIYCQYILQSGADLDRKVRFYYPKKTSSSGKLTRKAVGKCFTVDELITYAIVNSDNMAYRLLYETFGYKDFNAYIKSLGLQSPLLGSSSEYSKVTARSMGKCMLEIYRYSKATGNTYLTDLMKNTAFDEQISKGVKAETAHKYGQQGGKNGYHDIAVIYAKEPYILSIFTNVDVNDPDCNSIFVKLSELTAKLHNELHSEKKKEQTSEKNQISYEEYMSRRMKK
ncbi:MAG: serine hydrolase [Huintestinicola sp.]